MKRFVQVTVFGLMIVFVLFSIGVSASSSHQNDAIRSKVEVIGDNAQAVAIEALIKHSYDVNAVGFATFDTSQYPSVYINDSKVSLVDDQPSFLNQVRNVRGSSSDGLEDNGYLSFKIAQTLDAQRGVEGLEKVEAQAKAAGRSVTSADLKSIKGIVGVPRHRSSMAPSIPDQPNFFSYKSIKINGSYAEVEYDDGAALAKATLVRTQDGWRIAGIQAINIHF